MYRDETKNLIELMNLKDYSLITHLGPINNVEYEISGSTNVYFTWDISTSKNSILYLGSLRLTKSMISGLTTSQYYYFRFNWTHKINSINYKAYPIWADNTNVRNADNPYIPYIDEQSVVYMGYSEVSASSAGLNGVYIIILFIPSSYSSFFS